MTLPVEIVEEIDRLERNRSKFVLAAIRRELERCRREALRRSLSEPHTDGEQFDALGFDAWAGNLPQEDVSELIDVTSGTPVNWQPGKGWKASRRP